MSNKNNLGFHLRDCVIKGSDGCCGEPFSALGRFSLCIIPLRIGILVNYWLPTRQLGPGFNFVFFWLAISVFSWGLQYKLSLYDPPKSSSHQIPSAKLLSKDEQAAKVYGPLISKAKISLKAIPVVLPSVFLFFLLALNLPNSPSPGQDKRESCPVWRLCHQASMNVFFFRPPPVLS